MCTRLLISTFFTPRCLAHRLNLDSDDPQLVCRCHELSRAFIQSLTIKELWNDYGIVDGILVWDFLVIIKNRCTNH